MLYNTLAKVATKATSGYRPQKPNKPFTPAQDRSSERVFMSTHWGEARKIFTPVVKDLSESVGPTDSRLEFLSTPQDSNSESQIQALEREVKDLLKKEAMEGFLQSYPCSSQEGQGVETDHQQQETSSRCHTSKWGVSCPDGPTSTWGLHGQGSSPYLSVWPQPQECLRNSSNWWQPD